MENQSLSILITKRKCFLLVILFLLLISSCKKNKEIVQEDISTNEEAAKTINQYKGLWYCEKSDAFQNLLDMGLVLQLGIYTDGKFNIIAVIGDEQQLLNSGTWTLSDSLNKCNFILPDQEYGGTIEGSFTLEDKKLFYRLADNPEQSSVFVKY